ARRRARRRRRSRRRAPRRAAAGVPPPVRPGRSSPVGRAWGRPPAVRRDGGPRWCRPGSAGARQVRPFSVPVGRTRHEQRGPGRPQRPTLAHRAAARLDDRRLRRRRDDGRAARPGGRGPPPPGRRPAALGARPAGRAGAPAATTAASTAPPTGPFPAPGTITLPRGQTPSFALAAEELTAARAMAGTVTDAGDDPAATHGALVRATVRVLPAGRGVVFRAGPGVGTVSRPGLPLEVGEPAVNPVPRQMMRDHVALVAGRYGGTGDVEITLSVG